MNQGVLNVRDSILADGEADSGGLIFNGGQLHVSGSILLRGSAVQGGAVFNAGDAVFENSFVTQNAASSGFGGAGVMNQGDASFASTHVFANTSGAFGGGISSEGTLSLADSIVTDNDGPLGAGIAILDGSYSVIGQNVVAANSGYDIATFQRGVPGTLLQPEVSAIESSDPLEDQNQALVDFLDGRANDFDLGPIADITQIDLQLQLPAWNQSLLGTLGADGTGYEISYDGYGYTVVPRQLVDTAIEALAWDRVTVTDVQTSAGGSVSYTQSDALGSRSHSIGYRPPTGLVGEETIVVSGTIDDGQAFQANIAVTISDTVRGNIVLETSEPSDDLIRVDVRLPGNGQSLDVQGFALALGFDQSVVQLDQRSQVSARYQTESGIDHYQATGDVPAHVSVRGSATSDVDETLATIYFKRFNANDPGISIVPEFQWSVSANAKPLTPTVLPAINETRSAYDTNFDGKLTPSDLLLVLNALSDDANDVNSRNDVNGDQLLTPGDALMVINALSDQASEALGDQASEATVPQNNALSPLAATDAFFSDDEDEVNPDDRGQLF